MDMKQFKNPYIMLGIIILALGLTYFLASYVVPKVMVSLTKAAPAYTVSLGNSRIIGEKILAKADGKDTCIVDVFVLDISDKGVPGRKVSLSGMENVTPATATTDNLGKASFELVSTVEKQYEILANVDGVQMTQTMKVTFRN